jgi:hypothetical protein
MFHLVTSQQDEDMVHGWQHNEKKNQEINAL